jgi:hypothetical protein
MCTGGFLRAMDVCIGAKRVSRRRQELTIKSADGPFIHFFIKHCVP